MVRKIDCKKLFFTLLSIVFVLSFFSTDALALWAKRFDTGWNDAGGIWPTSDGNYYLWSMSSDPSGSGKKYLIFSKLNASGTVQWAKKVYKGDYDELIIIEQDDGFFVTGTTRTSKDGPKDIIWAKFNSSFNQLYGKLFGGSRDDDVGFEKTNDGGWIGTGRTNSYGPEDDQDILILKLDSSGNLQWSKVFHHGLDDGSAQILELSNGYMLCASVANTTSGGEDILVAKLNSSGSPQWVKLYGGIGINNAVIHEISGGNFLLWGTTQADVMSFDTDIILIKIDGSGNIVWAKKYGSSKLEIVNNVLENPDGTFLLNGSVGDIFSFNYDILLMKLDSTGNILWQKALGGSGFDVAGLEKTSDGNYFILGTTSSFGSNPYSDYDILFAKLSSLDPVSFLWQKRFGGTGFESGGAVEFQNKYFITGSTDSFGASNIDVMGVILDSSASYPECYINDVTLTQSNPEVTVSNLSWTATPTSLTERTAGTASNITLNVVNTTINVYDICPSTSEEPDITVNPSAVQFGNVNVGNSSDQTVTVQNDGTGNLTIGTISSPSTPFSKVADNCSGHTLSPLQSCTVTYRFTPTSGGSFSGNSNIPSNDPDENPKTVTLSGTGVALPGGVLSVTPSEGFNSSGNQGGPFSPSSKDYVLENTGGASINWTATKTKPWIDLSKTGGSLAPGASTTVTVSINSNANALSPGTHSDTITFTNTTNHVGDTTRIVTLTVNLPPQIYINLSSPEDGAEFSCCSYYAPIGPPTFRWETNATATTFKTIVVQFYTADPTVKPVTIKGKVGINEVTPSTSLWKKILLLPGTGGGTVYWKVVGTPKEKGYPIVESNIFSFTIESANPVGNPALSHTSRTTLPPPTLSWLNLCNIKFKVWFYNDPEYYDNPQKAGVKKKAFSFKIQNPNDSGGVFSIELTTGQWTSVRKLVGDIAGSTLYWHVESWDLLNRFSKTGRMSFVLDE
ncbi:MAG: choice-of-anchor D domain-containing protein [Candidatus Methanomethylicaceae archaeon]